MKVKNQKLSKMNLPTIHQLRDNQSTYITFSKALTDFDRAIALNSSFYFTKMVALNLPVWVNPDFFINLSTVNIGSTNPNLVVPKTIQYYLENILRQDIGVNETTIEECVEIAFWKMLNKMGLSNSDIRSRIVFSNDLMLSNYVKIKNNHGWGEIIGQVPNKCNLLTPAWKPLSNIANIVQAINTDLCLFDNDLKQFLFSNDFKQVIDFENCQYDEVTVQDFNFNTLLLFYKDDKNVHKLHGINFIYPFENKVSSWDLPKFTHFTNEVRTIGYQFKFNIKTCNNEASLIQIYENQEHCVWRLFDETLGKLNSFLDVKIRESKPFIPFSN
jgi:hypothetical protein